MLPPKRRINYSQVMNQVSSIRELSKNTNKVADNLDDVLVQTVKVWSGDASKEFKKQCGIMIEEIESTARKLSEIAGKIASAASDIEREDDAYERRYNDYIREQERRERERREKESKKAK
ncbi:WXG100 family type VII secretion target [Acetivibrio cellulolyticus]|uniref:WXG100 family type VII secretion target n=1 Tax=Acetivibrio cellulolyticus TaxID=35830 RepID=UPI0001E2D9A3|nr:WXG100 family type VII secretion target [Acetivibrio cellulolyticus]